MKLYLLIAVIATSLSPELNAQNLVINPALEEFTGKGKPCMPRRHELLFLNVLDSFPGWTSKYSAAIHCPDCQENDFDAQFKVNQQEYPRINVGALKTRNGEAYIGRSSFELIMMGRFYEENYISTEKYAHNAVVTGLLDESTTENKVYFFSVWLSPSYAGPVYLPSKDDSTTIGSIENFTTADFGLDLWTDTELEAFLETVPGSSNPNEYLKGVALEATNPANNIINGNADSQWVELRIKFTATQDAPNFVFGIFPWAIDRAKTLERNPYFTYDQNRKQDPLQSFSYFADAFTLMPYPELGDTIYLGEGDSLVLDPNTPGADLEWFDGSGALQKTIYCPGTYWVRSSSQFTSITDSVVVLPKLMPWPLDTVLCLPNPVLGVTNKAYNIRWSRGDTTHKIGPAPEGSYTIEYTLPGGCSFTKSTTVSHDRVIMRSLQDTVGCDSLLFKIQNVADQRYQWSTGDTTASIQLNQSGSYWATAANSHCSRTQELAVTIEEKAYLSPNDSVLCNGRLFAFEPNLSYDWYWISEEQVQVSENKDLIIGWEQAGCGLQTDTFFVRFQSCSCETFLPNAISANGDGLNDLFKSETVCAYDEFTLRVFNRWGQLLFESNDPTEGWLPQDVPIGVYYYSIAYRSEKSQERFFKNGTLRLLR